MQLGMIGLGRMGANMVRRLLKDGHDCIVFDLDSDNVRKLEAEGAAGAESLEDFAAKLKKPRAAWVMVPAGDPTDKTVMALAELFDAGDAIVDGGNSYFKDDLRRAEVLERKGLDYLDVGVSGGVWGLERGYCLMIGGPDEAVQRLDPIFRTLAPGVGDVERTPGRDGDPGRAEQGYLHCGPVGAGHFVKMVHNGIEYGMMQAYAEGFDLLKSVERYDFDLGAIAEVWRRGSVVTSWLLDLTATALLKDPRLDAYSGYVQDSGEGRWTILTAVEEAVPADVLSAALYARFRSRQEHTFAEKVLSAMRHGFGGHTEPPRSQ
ncbi:MAG: decarboxylating 6-phosphogluconate dehydrogenase [Gemmatimonadota bacterium]|nr:MAG: decarboxylating 6-phosphogluconate dehydrogenase [Gemmatimonadota bacterium]